MFHYPATTFSSAGLNFNAIYFNFIHFHMFILPPANGDYVLQLVRVLLVVTVSAVLFQGCKDWSLILTEEHRECLKTEC
jgi:hypothetical protein